MVGPNDLTTLPDDLPIVIDDGAAAHLLGAALPRVTLRSTGDRDVDVGAHPGLMVIYAYPMTGVPGEALPTDWDLIPGARGCTPQACAYRDHHADLAALGAVVYGLSTNSPEHQREAAARLHLPFELLSDGSGAFADAMGLPTFEVDGVRLLKRLTLVTNVGSVERVHYPVVPSDADAERVVSYLTSRRALGTSEGKAPSPT